MNFESRFFKHGLIISLFLFLTGALLVVNNLLSITTHGFTVLMYVDHHGLSKNTPGDELLEGQKVKGVIQASQNYLGTVEILIDTFNRVNDDILIFRIREKGRVDWYYQNKYSAKYMSYKQFFPFGFPTIPNSKNKLYEFDIESQRGIRGNAIGVDYFNPAIVSRYQFPKKELLSKNRNFIEYTGLKIKNTLDNIDFITDIIIYLLPSFYFSFWYFSKKRYPSLTVLLLFIVLYDIFLIKNQRDSVFIILTTLWICHSLVSKFTSKISLSATIFFLSFPIITFSINQSWTEKSAVWSYMFLASTCISNVFESRILRKYKIVSISIFLTFLRDSRPIRLPIYVALFFIWGSIDIMRLMLYMLSFIREKIILFFFRFLNILKILLKNTTASDPPTILNFLISATRLIVFIITASMGVIVVIFIFILLIKFSIKAYMQIYSKLQAEYLRELRLSLDPIITTVEPKIVYHSTKIILYGHGFDQRSDRSSVLKLLAPHQQKEDVTIDYVDNAKIIFTVPLHWNTGHLYFWVETPITWQGKYITAKSNVVSVRLIPTITSYSPGFSPDDEAYFKQLEGLREETLRLNGHR